MARIKKQLVRTLKNIVPEVKAEEKKTPEYEEIIEPKKMTIADGVDLVFSVSKAKDGEPHLDIRTYIKNDRYTGPTKKGINFDLENMEEFLEILNNLNLELLEKGI